MSIFDTLFGGGQAQGYEDIQKALQQGIGTQQQYLGQATGYMQPYYQAGTSALGDYQKALGAMMNPQQFYQQMMSGYSMSPQAQMQQQQGIQAANQAASASGMLGSGAEQKELTQYAQQLTAADQQNWLNNMMGIQGKGLSGLQGLAQTGYGAGQQMGGWTQQTGQNISDLLYKQGQAKAGQDVAQAQGWQNLLGTGLNFLTGGLSGAGMIPSSGFWGGGARALMSNY